MKKIFNIIQRKKAIVLGSFIAATLCAVTATNFDSIAEGVKNMINVDPVKFSEIENSYYNVKDYGAKGDGITDDTEALRTAIAQAKADSGTVYFPAGKYLITESIRVTKDDSKVLKLTGDGKDSIILGGENLNESMFLFQMKYNLTMRNLSFEHNGPSGSIIDSIFLRAYDCTFSLKNSANTSPAVIFHGSDSKVSDNLFYTANKDSFALYYSMLDNEISINDYIIDNTFTGSGCGILVGDGRFTGSGRSEGLKINHNVFENTGESQVLVQEILHVDISNNKFSGAANSIVLSNKGHGADGIFISHNEISASKSCIRSDAPAGSYISMAVITNNLLKDAKYGIFDEVGFNKSFIRENTFSNITDSGIVIKNATHLVVMNNLFDLPKEVTSYDITGPADTVISGNVTNGNEKKDLKS